jgi:hypothetical protein
MARLHALQVVAVVANIQDKVTQHPDRVADVEILSPQKWVVMETLLPELQANLQSHMPKTVRQTPALVVAVVDF